MSTKDLDDEATLGLSLTILNGNIAFFDSCVFLSVWINHPTLEDRKQSLEYPIS